MKKQRFHTISLSKVDAKYLIELPAAKLYWQATLNVSEVDTK